MTLRTLIEGGFLTDQLDAILEHHSNRVVAPSYGAFQQPMNTCFTLIVVFPKYYCNRVHFMIITFMHIIHISSSTSSSSSSYIPYFTCTYLETDYYPCNSLSFMHLSSNHYLITFSSGFWYFIALSHFTCMVTYIHVDKIRWFT